MDLGATLNTHKTQVAAAADALLATPLMLTDLAVESSDRHKFIVVPVKNDDDDNVMHHPHDDRHAHSVYH